MASYCCTLLSGNSMVNAEPECEQTYTVHCSASSKTNRYQNPPWLALNRCHNNLHDMLSVYKCYSATTCHLKCVMQCNVHCVPCLIEGALASQQQQSQEVVFDSNSDREFHADAELLSICACHNERHIAVIHCTACLNFAGTALQPAQCQLGNSAGSLKTRRCAETC